MKSALLLLALSTILACLVSPASADDKRTVSSLIKDGYEIVAMMPSNAGPGILLQKDDSVMMCFVAETPQSADIATQYCKAVK